MRGGKINLQAHLTADLHTCRSAYTTNHKKSQNRVYHTAKKLQCNDESKDNFPTLWCMQEANCRVCWAHRWARGRGPFKTQSPSLKQFLTPPMAEKENFPALPPPWYYKNSKHFEDFSGKMRKKVFLCKIWRKKIFFRYPSPSLRSVFPPPPWSYFCSPPPYWPKKNSPSLLLGRCPRMIERLCVY